MEPKKHILLAEDDESMGFLLKDSLEYYNYRVTHFPNGKLALDAFNSQPFDLCVLDVMMPVMDGFTLATEIRKTDFNVPIIFLTAKVMKEDRINGFKLGADDYVTKPFSVEELSLRIKAILSRGEPKQKATRILHFANCELDTVNLKLITKTQTIQLTQKELDILELFVSHPNTLLKRSFILKSMIAIL